MSGGARPSLAAIWRVRLKPGLATRSLLAAFGAIVVWLCVDVGKDSGKAILTMAARGIGEPAGFGGSASWAELPSHLLLLALSTIGLTVASYVVVLVTPRLIRPQIRAKSGPDLAGRPVVILILSRPDRTDAQLCELLRYYEALSGEGEQIIYDTSPLSARFAWQHSLRALWRHLDPARPTRVHVVFSRETEDQLPSFRRFIALLAERRKAQVSVETVSGCPVGFDDFAACERVIGDLVHALAVRRGAPHRPRDLCLDVTGGTKMTGIASAIISMNRDLEFSYVPNGFSREKPDTVVFEANIQVVDIKGSGA